MKKIMSLIMSFVMFIGIINITVACDYICLQGERGIQGEKGEDGQDGKDGLDGVSVVDTTVNEKGRLIVTLSNGKTIDCGVVKGMDGESGSDCDCQPSYMHAIPQSLGVLNAIKRAKQLTDVTWTPLKNLPGVILEDGEWKYQEFEAGKEYKGVPYSGVIDTDTYVGLNVSLDSFITAVQNENSVVYANNLFSESYPKKATYYGTVCSKFVQYALNIPGAYNTANIRNIEGVETVALPGEYSEYDIRLGDIIVDPTYHTTICTDIIYDLNSRIKFIEISEALPPTARRLWWSVEEFFEEFGNYTLCRYRYIDSTPYSKSDYVDVEDEDGENNREFALMPSSGDKFNYSVSQSKGTVHILKKGYTKAVIVRNGEIVEEIPIDDSTDLIEFSREIPGYIEIYLEDSDGVQSRSVYGCVTTSSIEVTNAGEYFNGKIDVAFTGTSGTPLYVQIGTVSDSVYYSLRDSEDTSTTVSFDPSKVSTQRIRIAYKNEYGIYLSPWVKFAITEGVGINTSKDALLSQGIYWDGMTLTPNNATPIIDPNKPNYWTYTKVPVKPNTTYNSKGANRMWFFDSNGNAISTINIYKDWSPQYQFTTPTSAAYVGISYTSQLIEKGTETLIEVV